MPILNLNRLISFVACLLIGIIGVTVFPQAAFAFDTGDHYDLTQQALQDEEFAKTPVQIAQVENWLVDFFSNNKPAVEFKDEMAKLHFDNLRSLQQVRNYWSHLAVNTKNAVQEAARQNDALKLITLLGISLHAVQDFYTHSNWVETHPRINATSYRTDTWFSNPPQENLQLYTGYYPKDNPLTPKAHGDYKDGLNHDSYVRDGWDQSYVFAYAASREWINAVHNWVNEANQTFWQQAKTYTINDKDREALKVDLDAAYYLSEWPYSPFEELDGHWKGNGSGNVSNFLTFAAKWKLKADSPFVGEFKKRGIYRLLLSDLSADNSTIPAVPDAQIPKVLGINLARRAVIVRTRKVAEEPVSAWGWIQRKKIDNPPLGDADFYAKIKIADQTFTEAVQQNRSWIAPGWTSIRFVPTSMTSINIHYELWDEDTSSDDHCDINPSQGRQDLDFVFATNSHALSGDVNGVKDSETTAVEMRGRGDANLAFVKFYVTEKSLLSK
jgi:hypothetical protein